MAEWRTLERLAQTSVRVDPASAAARRLRLPLEPNTVAVDGGRRTLWLGPDEWLVVGPPGERGHLAPDLARTLGDEPGAAVDVSAQRAVIELSGHDAREVLTQ